jgi:hypothetical protein
METPPVDEFLMMTAGLVGAIAVIIGGGVAVYRFITSAIYKRLDSIDTQLHRNGGASLRDAIDRIEEKQTDIQADVRRTGERLDEHIDWHLDREIS